MTTTHGEGSLFNLLAAYHPVTEWCVLRHVRSGAGVDRRTADALAIGLWASRGHVIRGFELKITRQDFRRESDDPQKAESVAKFCDEWYLVTPKGLIREPELELPPDWGLLEADTALSLTRKATRHEGAPWTRGFLSQILKGARAAAGEILRGSIPRDQVAAELQAAEARGFKNGELTAGRMPAHFAEVQAAVTRFQQATGIDLLADRLDAKNWDEMIFAVNRSLALGVALQGRHGRDFDALRQSLIKAAELANDALKRLDEQIGTTP